MAPLCNTPTASSTSIRRTASVASTASPAVHLISRNSTPGRRRSTNARSVPIALAKAWNRRALRRAQQAGVYDPESIGGTHVIYVLHDATDPERYGGLPKNPTIPWSYTVWKWLFKPVLGAFALFGGLGVLLHYVTVGPRRPQPEPPEKEGTNGNGD